MKTEVPERPETPTCTSCGHTSMHNVGPGICYQDIGRNGLDRCDCVTPAWADPDLMTRWKDYSDKWYRRRREDKGEAALIAFRDLAATNPTAEDVLQFAEDWH